MAETRGTARNIYIIYRKFASGEIEALCVELARGCNFLSGTGNCSNVRFVLWGRALITVSPGKMNGTRVTHEGTGRN